MEDMPRMNAASDHPAREGLKRGVVRSGEDVVIYIKEQGAPLEAPCFSWVTLRRGAAIPLPSDAGP